MWGCLKALLYLFALVFIIFFIGIGGGWWYIGTSNFADFIRLRIESTLEARLGRDVTIKSVEIIRSRPQRVIINDLRVANAPGALQPYFATVRQVEITGGIDSFLGRRVRVGRVDVRDPRLFFEVFPQGAPLIHNFPKWQVPKPGKYQIYRLDMGNLFVSGGRFDFNDRRHNITAVSQNIKAQVQIASATSVYEGVMNSPVMRVRIQDYEPFEVDLNGGFRYAPGVLALRSIALRGRGIEAFVSGKLEPLTEGVYDLRLTSKIALERIREIFRVEKHLEGELSLDTNLRGKQGDFTLKGGWISPQISADTYDLTDAKGKLDVNGERMLVDVERAGYGGGTIFAHYTLSKYAEPYPMTVDLNYDRISVEQLFNDWTVENTGLRGAATGKLTYRWNKDKVLDGSGEGTARLSKNALVFSKAKYPIPIAGSTDYALNRGVVTFRRAELDTDRSHVSLTGTLRIEDVFTGLQMRITSSDFSELDRIGYNFAHSAGKDDYDLLGLGGAGAITGTLKGRLKTPAVAAHISGTGVKYNNVLLGAADIDLRYDGVRSELIFDRALFIDGNGRIAIKGSLFFPDRGPSPRFDIVVEAVNYPVDRAAKAVQLKLNIGTGSGTGSLIVTGTPDSGKVTFVNLAINRGEAQLRLNGDVAWLPGVGNVRFNLDIAARSFPVTDIITFLDLGTFPVTGEITGTLHLEGPKKELEGAGAVTVRNGSVFGEPIDAASADITFTKGRMKATSVAITSPAGEIKGEAELDLGTEKFSYTIQSSSIDLSKLKLLAAVRDLLGGTIKLSSSGAGTFEQPELVVEATLHEATIRGMSLPPDSPPPSIYIAIRNGRLIVRGSIADIVTIEGEGAVGAELAVDGLVRINIKDIAKLVAISPKTVTLPASGNAVIDLKLGGKLSPIEALRIDGTVPTLLLRVSEREFTPRGPLRFGLRNGRLEFDSFELQRNGSLFTVAGFAEVTGAKRLGIDVRGNLEAALLQLFVPDVRADGQVAAVMSIRGTLAKPSLTGTAELQDAQIKFAGFPQLIDNINGTLEFKGERIDIVSLRATLGGGTVTAGGYITVEGLTPQRARVNLKGNDVSIRYFEGITVEGDFDLQVGGDMERVIVQGDVDVTRALYSKEFNFQQSILNVILSRRGIVPITAAAWQERVDLRIRMKADETLAVKNNLADVTGSAQLDLMGTLANPIIIGTVTLDEGGNVTFQNVEYRVVRGTINFQNPFRIDPYFDVTIEGRVSGNFSEIESGPLDLTVNITGTLDRINPTITSDPPASDITLFSLLGFGSIRSTEGGPSGSVMVNQSVQSQLISMIGQRILPFADSFTYDPGLLDTAGGGARVTFEKRISPDIRLLIVYNLDSHQSREVVEWIVSNDWTLQITRDQLSSEFRIDARFRRRYEGRWSWGARQRQLDAFATRTISAALAEMPAPPPATRVQAVPKGRTVTNVVYRSDGRFDTSTLTQYVAVKPGQELSIRDVQSSIKSLFATGNFRDIRADTDVTPEGTVVAFSLFLNYRIGDISFDGLSGSARQRALRLLALRTGDVLSLNAVDRGAVAIAEELRRNGYVEASVDPETSFKREINLAEVVFHVERGPRAKVATVTLDGNLAPFTEAELVKRMREQPGRNFKLADARRDVDRIKNYLVRRDYRKADVDFLGQTYDKETDSVILRYRVEVGPEVKVEVSGVDRGAVRGLIPFTKNQEYSEDVIDRAADNVTKAFQQRGYLNVAVDTESGLQGGTWVTVFKVQPGLRYRLSEVRFTGNLKVRDKKLAKLIQTSPSGGVRRLISTLLRRQTGITREQLNDDRDAIESYYRLQGFSEATVAAPVTIARADGTLSVEFPVDEGPQTIVTEVTIEGAEKIGLEDIPRTELRAGDPLNPQLERQDVANLQSFYADRGYTEAQVAPRREVSADKTSAKITYTISEGPQINVADVIVRGNTYTDSSVILRKSELNEGQPFSYGSILEAQRNLYRLGIFNRVDVQPEQSGTSVSDRNVVIQVEEGRNLTVSGSVGVRARTGSEAGQRHISPRFAAAIAHRNLFGTGRYLGLQGVSSGEEREAFLTYREPFIGRYNIPVQLSIFQTDDKTVKERRIQQRGTSIEASKVAFLRTRWSMQYQYKISECMEGQICTDLAAGIPVPELDRSLLNIQISSITPTFFWDRRDDIVNPHRGFFTSASIEYAFKFISADAQFTKEFVQGAWYLPVSARNTIVLSARAGLIQPRGRSLTGSNLVPLSERFTAGGDTSHRAYPLDLLGTLCNDSGGAVLREDPDCRVVTITDPVTGLPRQVIVGSTLYDLDSDPNEFRLAPLGGNGMIVMNAEYRFPIFSSVGGALFADAGNIFADNTIHFGNLRYGIGAGIRYGTSWTRTPATESRTIHSWKRSSRRLLTAVHQICTSRRATCFARGSTATSSP